MNPRVGIVSTRARLIHIIARDLTALCGRPVVELLDFKGAGVGSRPVCRQCANIFRKCPTCKGTRIAPVADEDLGGSGVTMSSCPDCVKV
jgi:hypothetical protein